MTNVDKIENLMEAKHVQHVGNENFNIITKSRKIIFNEGLKVIIF